MTQPYTTRETNVRSFPHTPREEESSTSTSSSSTTTTTTTGTSSSTTTVQNCQNIPTLTRLNCETLRELYQDCIGEPMTKAIHRRLLLDLLDGTPYAYYRYAIEETALAPRPSWRYVMAIVTRLRREKTPPEDLLPL